MTEIAEKQGRLIRSVSLYPQDIEELALIKAEKGIHLSGVVRVGIRHLKEETETRAEQYRLRETNAKLSEKVQRLSTKVWELERDLK